MDFVAILLIGVIITIPVIITLSNQNKESEKIRKEILEKKLKEKNFNIYAQYSFDYINNESVNEITNSAKYLLDKDSKKICIVHRVKEDYGKDHYAFIDFGKITDCKVEEDSEVMGGVGRAVVGGILAGGIGAIVGSVTAKKHITSYKILIFTSDIINPCITLVLINSKTKTNSTNYTKARTFAQNVYASLTSIILTNKKQ